MIIKIKTDKFKYFIDYYHKMVKLEKSKNKKEIKYLEQILEKVGEINAKADHLITVFRERYYTHFNCPYADLKYMGGKVKGHNNNNCNASAGIGQIRQIK